VAQDNKTEQATPRRRQKAREKGQIARSRELIGSLAAAGLVLGLSAQAAAFPGEWRTLLRSALDAAATGGDGTSLLAWSHLAVFRSATLALGLGWILALAGAVAQGGLVFSPSTLAFNPARLSPASRLRQLLSITAVSRLLKSLVPVAAVVYLAVAVLGRDWAGVLQLSRLSARGLAGFTVGRIFEIAWKSALVLLAWSGADYFFERRKLETDLRMSRQELMDEFKETEGNPAVKARIRRLQRQVRRRRMLEEVRRASVVITNPSEFAVALEYRPQMAAPVVIAKGRNLLAREIKQVARWHDIPLVENPPLAHALYRAVEIGQSIPPKLYAVVAGILAAIYRAQQAAARGGR
jgi:flagellar biosynthesis protein FlhB